MKKQTIILLAFILITIGRADGQTYTPFPTSDGFWKEISIDGQCVNDDNPSGVCNVYQYILSGDTVINNITYKKLNSSGVKSYTGQYKNGGYCGCYRNDIINKKVYYLPKNSIHDTLLYDFNLHLNDTLPISYIYDRRDGIFTIDKIDSVLMGSTYLKEFHISKAAFGEAFLIEGIGSTLGLFGFIRPYFEQMEELICFKNNKESLFYERYSSYKFANCDSLTNIIDKSKVK